ncbi:MAG: NYN domain-containing protein [Candidatus Saccharimonadales bacterium]
MRHRTKQKPVYAFIDSQNLNQSIQRLGWKMDWHKFRSFLTDRYGVTHAYMFIGYVPEFEAMYQQLHETGYLIVLKPTYDMTRPRPDDKSVNEEGNHEKTDDEKKPTKGNIDADLVLWAMKELGNYSKAVIVSGDGDFYSLVEYLDAQNKLLKLLAPSMFYSNLYNKYEDYVERLDLHRKDLAYWDGKRRTLRKK